MAILILMYICHLVGSVHIYPSINEIKNFNSDVYVLMEFMLPLHTCFQCHNLKCISYKKLSCAFLILLKQYGSIVILALVQLQMKKKSHFTL